ncbi:MAG: glycosyltransferase [Patescibacteria group bacterium]
MNKIRKIYWAYRNKISNKLFGKVRMPALGKKKGEVLVSYITEPFTIAPWEKFSNFHTMYWECFEIARLFSERGYACDIIGTNNTKFIPLKPYVACIDAEGLERLVKYLPTNCKKVFHILISHWDAYNKAEEDRLEQLKKRRGVRLLPRRKMRPSRDAELADYLEGFGNKTIFETFKGFGKPVFFIPISAVLKFDFPKNKNFESVRRSFLWLGGGGSVLKGLDLTLEAFAITPQLHLHVCGPVGAEKDFVEEYKNELYNTPNIHFHGRIDIGGEKFAEIVNKCGAVVYPSGGEGSSGAIVQAMHAGLVPIITHETGIQEDSKYIALIEPTPESVSEAVINFSNLTPERIKDKSYSIWKYAQTHYTREEFSKAYAKFIDSVLKL